MKKTILFIILIVVFSGGAFYGGLKYSQAKKVSMPNDFQQRGARMGGNVVSGSGANSGEIIAIDNQSLTLKDMAGGSKIIFYATSTEVSKFIKGEISDLVIGANVMISGKTNTDGSMKAQIIQLRPTSTSIKK